MRDENDISLYKLAVKSTLGLFLSRAILQTINLVRRIVLLRLLFAKDFGIFAIALFTIDIINTFSEIGIFQALIQKKKNIVDYLDSAWTFNIIRSFIMYTACFFLAPLFASFFDMPSAVPIIRVLAFSLILTAFNNIGTIYFQKEIRFEYQVFINICASVIDFIALLFFLLAISRSVWALAFSRLISSMVQCVLSYLLHPYRPKFKLDLSKIKELWLFGKHIWGTTILKFFCLHGDDALLGKIAGAVTLGFYRQAFDIGTMLANEIGNKIAQVSFPVYAKIQDNKEKIKSGYLKLLTMTSFIIFPATGGLFILAGEITQIILGEKWMPMVPALKVLCLLSPLKSMQRAPVFLALGRPDILRKTQQYRFLLLAMLIFPLTIKWGMLGASYALLINGIILQVYGFYQLKKLIAVHLSDMSKVLLPSAFLSLLMAIVLYFSKNIFEEIGVLHLIALISFGILIYLGSHCILALISKNHNIFRYFKEILKGIK